MEGGLEVGDVRVEVRHLDTSDLTSVRKFAKRILEDERSLHVLINNAGMMGCPKREVTQDGLELTMATNYYGHFLLTNLLLGLMKKSSPGRIIALTSSDHSYVNKLNPDSLNFEREHYSSRTAYGQTSLCNILFSVELASKLEGTGVTANSVHPGCVHTEFFYKGKVTLFSWICRKLYLLMGKDVQLGAQPTIYLAVSQEVEDVSGQYFVDCQVAKTSELARQKKLAKQVWEATEVDVKLQPEEKHY
ncbi:retinol dehydrogenase 11-like isoform X2 [Panulirus ornatus]